MMQLLPNDQIQKDKWDQLISESKLPLIYGFSWYLDIVAPNWCAIVNDDYSIGFPIYTRRKFSIPYIIQPPWTQQLGFFSKIEINTDVIQEVIFFLKKKYLWCSLRFNESNRNLFPIISKKISIIWHNNYLLNLDQPYDKIYQHFSKNLKRNLKKSEKLPYFLKSSTDYESVVKIFKQNQGINISSLSKRNFATLFQLLETLYKKQLLSVYHLYDGNNNLIAGVIFLTFSGRATLLLSGIANGLAKKYYPLHTLINYFITNRTNEVKILDFEGSDNPNLARFYAQFGSVNYPYPELYFSKLPLSRKFIEIIARFI